MPLSDNIKITIDSQEMEVTSVEDLPIAITYKLEDREDFQKKKSSESLSIVFPATLNNSKVSNTFHSPSIEDLTADTIFRNERPAVIAANGIELLAGKAFLKNAKHKDRPTSYEYDIYGNNADWMLDLQESTFFDFLKNTTFDFTKANIISSWAFDGTDESLPYVFAPVRYGQQMDASDTNCTPEYLRPAISKYFIIYWAFKSLGYKIKSDFFDTSFFRKQVMPWTWGNFLFSEGTAIDQMRFLALSSTPFHGSLVNYNAFVDCHVDNDSSLGGYDNGGYYSYNAGTKEMVWTYLSTPSFGKLAAGFHIALAIQQAAAPLYAKVEVHWFKNGAPYSVDVVYDESGTHAELVEVRKEIEVVPTDVISAKVHLFTSFLDSSTDFFVDISVDSFEIEYFRQVIGSIINFTNFLSFKKYKFLDFLRGVIDEFNLSVQTDSINKTVYFEPTHPYSLTNNLATRTGGYFNEDFIDWTDKQDISKESVVDNYNDSERELLFKYKDDASDGILKKVQDRHATTLASAKYVLPSRFKKGKKEIENRFFSPVMHYDVEQWRSITGTAPQMVCLVPENISNTSRDEAQNTFAPKSCYYKGLTSSYGWTFDADNSYQYPFMFAVNYKPGGQNDPILSYSDEKIGLEGNYTVGKGLLRRFYLQRMAIMRNGQYYDTYFRINNNDVARFLHREHIIAAGQRWELVEINNYRPLKEESTGVHLRRWVPVSQADSDNVFPQGATITGTPSTNSFEVKYSQLKCLSSDIQ